MCVLKKLDCERPEISPYMFKNECSRNEPIFVFKKILDCECPGMSPYMFKTVKCPGMRCVKKSGLQIFILQGETLQQVPQHKSTPSC